ncbi:MAG: hypothetical protein IPF85_25040 [Anaerolineae bacterium]|nr:hypothetical protein [Anaerolineae bacterium]
MPFDSRGRESCWRWGQKLTRENIKTTTSTSNVVARRKQSGEYGIYEKYRKTTFKAKSIWFENEVISEKGTVELGELGLSECFDFPKPAFLVKKVLQLATDGTAEDTIVDFFAGSCTTAQAVFDLNREDGGNRRFIMVQLPEPTPDESPAQRTGFGTIAEIGRTDPPRHQAYADRRGLQAAARRDAGGSGFRSSGSTARTTRRGATSRAAMRPGCRRCSTASSRRWWRGGRRKMSWWR